MSVCLVDGEKVPAHCSVIIFPKENFLFVLDRKTSERGNTSVGDVSNVSP